jgi:hypothetical protein
MEDIGFSGSGSRFNSRFESGAPIGAKQLNELSSAIQTSLPMPYLGAGPSVSFTAGGSIITDNRMEVAGGGLLQQFQIVVEQYSIEGVPVEGVSIIRVVKGEVVWSPKLEKDSILPSNSCTTQTTIENWFSLPSFPIIDDDNATFIGDGGIYVPTTGGVAVGIFILKANNLTFDPDPIIVATPDFVPSCPVVFPGDSPFEDAVWEVVKIGSAVYVEPDPEADPPVAGGWEITQNFIGSMTLPGDGNGAEPAPPPYPPQLPSTAIQTERPMPFECRIEIDSSGDMLLRIGTGAVSYTSSNMPWVGIGATANKFQDQYLQLQSCPAGWRKQGSGGDLAWMELGGGYKIQGYGEWYLVACHWDATEGEGLVLPDAVKNGKPFLALIDAYGSDVDKLFVETGPGLYTNTMNVSKMSGYTSADTGEDWDWGYCHTTYFNPMKFGYDIKQIAYIEASPADSAAAQVITYQSATTNRNEIQNIYFPVLPKDGFVTFTYDGVSSGPFYPAPWSGFNNATNLFDALQVIPALKGNITVTRTSEHNFYVTFINALQATDVPTLVAVNALQSWQYKYNINQLHIGTVLLDAGPKFDGTQIMNKEGVHQTDDPYVVQSNASPPFNNVINRADLMACSVSGDNNFTAGIIPLVDNGSPRDVTRRQWQYGVAAGCTPDSCKHPFYVHEGDVVNSWEICTGSVNNKIPSNINDSVSIYDGYIWIQTAFASNDFPHSLAIGSGPFVPPDSDTNSYIAIARIVEGERYQLITSSLWGDRLKIGAETARYYYAQI